MQYFKRHYVKDPSLKILDVGSRVLNGKRIGCYKDVFSGWSYLGVDIIDGINVDIVVPDCKFPFEDETFDIVISGQTFEHVETPWLLIVEMARVLKKDGIMCIIAPNSGGEHKFPFDTYRYFPDGFKALAKWGGLEVLQVQMEGEDTYLIAKK